MYKENLTGAVEYTDCISAMVRDSPNESPGYGTKQSDGEVPVELKLREVYTTPSLPSLPGPLWFGVEALYRVLTKLCTYTKLNCLK